MSEDMTRKEAIATLERALRVARTNRPFAGDMGERLRHAARVLADFGCDEKEALSVREDPDISPAGGGRESTGGTPVAPVRAKRKTKRGGE